MNRGFRKKSVFDFLKHKTTKKKKKKKHKKKIKTMKNTLCADYIEDKHPKSIKK